jgi:hypothetical protein
MKMPKIKHFLYCCPILASLVFVHVEDVKGENVQKTAKQFILDFQRGVHFSSSDPFEGIAPNKHVTPATLFLLSKELAEGTPQVREDIVHLLEKLAICVPH